MPDSELRALIDARTEYIKKNRELIEAKKTEKAFKKMV